MIVTVYVAFTTLTYLLSAGSHMTEKDRGTETVVTAALGVFGAIALLQHLGAL